MNSTRWVTLTEFVKHLGRSGIARVDETEKGWFLAWIDSSPKALEKQVRDDRSKIHSETGVDHSLLQEAALKKERSTMSDEQRERLLIAEQIERAKAEEGEQVASGSGSSDSPPPTEEGLKREEGAEKVVLSLSTKPTAAITTSSVGLKLNANPLKANPLRRPNVFKTAASSSTPSTLTSSGTKRPAAPQSAAERLIFEDQERKRRKMEREAA